MAFSVLPAPSGKHRRVREGHPRKPARTTATLAGVVALTAAGALGATAAAAPGPSEAPARETVFSQAIGVNGALAHSLAAQAAGQHEAADATAEAHTRAAVAAKAKADAARRKAAAAARTRAEAKARAAARAAAAVAARAKARTEAAEAAPSTARAAAPQAADRSETRTALTGGGYTTPVGDAAIGTPYHAAGANWSSGYHTGVDFLVSSGTSVHAVAAGTVVSAGWDGSYGNDVIIRHADGKYTLYGHLTQALVSAGQSVTEGQQIGISGATGNVTGPHLHFEVRTTPDYGSDIDPVAYLRSHGVSV